MAAENAGWVTVAAIVCAIGAGACGPADQSPLGGPYGGTVVPPPPDQATSQIPEGGTSTPPASDDGGAAETDAWTPAASQPDAGGGSSAPTWTTIYQDYLSAGSEGHCGNCHNQTASASAAYSWLQSKGYIGGTNSSIVRSSSCLTWFGGSMPPGGPSDAKAVADMTAWVAAGAQND